MSQGFQKKYLLVDEVGDILRISRRQVYYLIASAEIQIFKIGSSTRILHDSLEDYVNRQIEKFENS